MHLCWPANSSMFCIIPQTELLLLSVVSKDTTSWATCFCYVLRFASKLLKVYIYCGQWECLHSWQHQNVSMQICAQICLRVLCERDPKHKVESTKARHTPLIERNRYRLLNKVYLEIHEESPRESYFKGKTSHRVSYNPKHGTGTGFARDVCSQHNVPEDAASLLFPPCHSLITLL